MQARVRFVVAVTFESPQLTAKKGLGGRWQPVHSKPPSAIQLLIMDFVILWAKDISLDGGFKGNMAKDGPKTTLWSCFNPSNKQAGDQKVSNKQAGDQKEEIKTKGNLRESSKNHLQLCYRLQG